MAGAPSSNAGANIGGSAGAPSSNAGSSFGGSAGAEIVVPEPNAFSNAPAYASAPVTVSAAKLMTTGGNPTKTQCLSCHTGDSKASKLLSGGTIFVDAAASTPAVDHEVRIVDTSNMQAYSAHTDENGNFWVDPGALAASGPFLIGVRNGTRLRVMPLVQRGLECNGSACHGGKQGPVHLDP